jgi:hypothetical protein
VGFQGSDLHFKSASLISVLDGYERMPMAIASARSVTVALSAFLLAGCYSDFPADSRPQLTVDRELLGTWWCPSGDHLGQLKVKARDQFWYEVTTSEPKRNTERYVGYASSIGGRTVINLKPAGTKMPRNWDHTWIFVAVSNSNRGLNAQLLDYNVLTGKERSSEEVRHNLEEGIASGKAFDENEGEPCRRAKQEVR